MEIHVKCGGDSFVWLETKAHSNVRKHGVRFEEAATVFGATILCWWMHLETMKRAMP